MVVVYHAFPNLLPGGFIGVDIFFVISGYLITTIMLLSLQKSEFSLAEFYGRRVRRLFPALITVLIFSLLLGWFVLFPTEYEQLGEHVSKSVIFWQNFELINEVGYFDVESHYKPLLHLWTLSVEEQYYIVWPVILLFFLRFNKHPVYLFAFVFFISLIANIYFAPEYTQETYYHTLTRFWELAAGSLLAVMLVNKKVNSNRLFAVAGGIIIIISALLINGRMVYPGFLAIAPVLGAVLIILANSQLPTYLGLEKLGLISYPLYLWHWILISFVFIYLGRHPSVSALLITVFSSLAFAFLTYKYIEPLRYFRKSTPYLILVLVSIGLVGVYIDKEKGLSGRASVDYLAGLSIQFHRTPAKDSICTQYASSKLKTQLLFDYCRAQNVNLDKLIAIIGDSHAHVLFPGMAEIANKYGYGALLIANSSCPTLIGFMEGRNEKDVKICQDKIKQILKILKEDKRITKVVMATRGPVYIHGEVAGKFTSKSVAESLLAQNKKEKNNLTYDDYFSGYRSTIKKIESMEHINNIYYMIENPELDFLPKEVVPRPYDVFGISANRNTMDRKLYLKRMSVYRWYVENIKFSKLVLLDPIDALCDKDNCMSFKNGKFLYADDDHFSVYGSFYIAKFFEKIIFGSVYSQSNSGLTLD